MNTHSSNKTMVYKLTFAALLVAVDVIAARFLFLYIPFDLKIVRLSPQFLAHAIAGWVLGPWWALGSAVAGDILGMLLNSAGLSFSPGFTLSSGLSGLIYGLILFKKPVDWRRCLLSVAAVVVPVSLCLSSFWLSFMQERPWIEIVVIALPWRIISIPVYTLGLYYVQKGISPQLLKMRGFWK